MVENAMNNFGELQPVDTEKIYWRSNTLHVSKKIYNVHTCVHRKEPLGAV